MKLFALSIIIAFSLSLTFAQEAIPKSKNPGTQLKVASNLMLGGMVVTTGGLALNALVFEEQEQKILGYGVTLIGGFMTIYGIAMIGEAGRLMEKQLSKSVTIAPVMDSDGIGICLKF